MRIFWSREHALPQTAALVCLQATGQKTPWSGSESLSPICCRVLSNISAQQTAKLSHMCKSVKLTNTIWRYQRGTLRRTCKPVDLMIDFLLVLCFALRAILDIQGPVSLLEPTSDQLCMLSILAGNTTGHTWSEVPHRV